MRAFAPDRRAYFEQFLGDYITIRNAEGRGSHGPRVLSRPAVSRI